MKPTFRLAACCLLVCIVSGCATQPIEGGFQEVCDKLVAMSPADRAMNMSSNGPHYQEIYGIYYDSLTDALYTRTAAGNRDYILKGDVFRAATLIDTRKDKTPIQDTQ